MQFVDMPVFVQRQVLRVQVMQNWEYAAAHFRTTCVRVLRRGVRFVDIFDMGTPWSSFTRLWFRKRRTLGVSELQFFLGGRHPKGHADADPHVKKFLGRRSSLLGCIVSTQVVECRDCAVEKTVVTPPRCDAEADHHDTGSFGKTINFAGRSVSTGRRWVLLASQFTARRSCGNSGELKRENVRALMEKGILKTVRERKVKFVFCAETS